ncbi:MAG: hypothetical protein GXO77_02110 [Calditrichaeota bacterium]|nr:hypothetical protein [Calditrichota bacterium]
MLRICFWIIVFVIPVFAQYYPGQVLERQFESSNLYFERFYLNTFGLKNFSKVAPGLMEDTFIRLSLNPAYGVRDTLKKPELYLDFRRTREEEKITTYPIPMPYTDSYYYVPPDPRWYGETRKEPEPVFSLGLRYKPFTRLHIAAAYQLIYKEEPFYQTPVYIYNPRYGYAAPDRVLTPVGANVPTVIRNQRNDQLLTRAHLFAGYLGYRLNDKTDIGLGLTLVKHKRSGDYLNLSRSEYIKKQDQDWFSSYSIDRNLNYKQTDFFVGMRFIPSKKLNFGFQAGMLQGNADQTRVVDDTSHSSSRQDANYFKSFRRETKNQRFKHDGKKYYSTLTANFRPDNKSSVFIFASFSRLNADISDRSLIADTSYYHNFSQSGLTYREDLSNSALFDKRTSSGEKKEDFLEAMITLKSHQSPRTRFHVGMYYSYRKTIKNTTEPVLLNTYWYWEYQSEQENGEYSHDKEYKARFEDKTLKWRYEYIRQSLQFPIYWWRKLNDNIAFFTILNKYWVAWKTKEKTEAIFKERRVTDGDETVISKNFIEKYLNDPNRNYTEDKADLILGVEVNITKKAMIRYTINPDFSPETRIAQWWISLTTRF